MIGGLGAAYGPKAAVIAVAELPRPPEWPLGAHKGPRAATGDEPIAQDTLPRPPEGAGWCEEDIQVAMQVAVKNAQMAITPEEKASVASCIWECALASMLFERGAESAEGA